MRTENYYIRGFRNDEWELLRDMRLHALHSHSAVFSSTYAREAAFDEVLWLERINSVDGKVFGLFADRRLIGITGIFRDSADMSGRTAVLCMSYIDAGYRGLGLSRLLYQARIDWARANGFSRIVVSHRDGNEASRRANAAFGFQWYASDDVTFGDGIRALDHRYELRL